MDRSGALGGYDSWEDAEPVPAQPKYPIELRERAVKMVLEIRSQDGKGRGELVRVAQQLGVHPMRCGRGSADGNRRWHLAGHDHGNRGG